MFEVRCPKCNHVLTKATLGPGSSVEGYCRDCRLEVTVLSRARRTDIDRVLIPVV